MRCIIFVSCLSCPIFLFLLFINFGISYATFKIIKATNADNFDGKDFVKNPAVALKGRLVFAHVIYRHGDRMPIEPYPTDPYNNPEVWPTGWGQLTNLGKMQHYHLGQWLRKRFDSLLSRSFSVDEIYIRSTDVDRTLMSALSNLAGLYPPTDKQVWNNDIQWQPIPVHTIPIELDQTLGKAPCAAYEHALCSLLNSPEFQELNKRYSYLYNYLSKYTGLKVNTLEAVQRLNNTLFIESLYNKTLPDWTKEIYPSTDMTYISKFYFKVWTYNTQLARLKAGPLVLEMLERFVAKWKNNLVPDRNVWIYSAHDITVANILNALKLFDLHSPEYTACITIEMRLDDNNKPYISIFYKNDTTVDNPAPLFIPACGYSCPLEYMFNLYREILPHDWKQECKVSTLLMTYEEANVSLAMGILVAIISVMLILSYMVMIYYRRRSYKHHFAYSQVA